jgi:hypothetical protein
MEAAMMDEQRKRPAGDDAPNAASESAKVHGDKLEELIPRRPSEGGAAGARRGEHDGEGDGGAEEPRGHA